MKSLFTKLVGLSLAATCLLASCEKDEDRAVLQPSAAPTVTASTNTVVLQKVDAAKPAVTFTWTAADFGYQAATTYTLQFDKKGNSFKTPQSVAAGSSLTRTLTVTELNDVLQGLKLENGKAAALDVRVQASVGEAVSPLASAASSLTATPYESRELPKDIWRIIGSATPGSWSQDTNMTYDFDTKTWSVLMPLTADEFKFRANADWTLNYGDTGADGKLEAGGDNIKVPAAGTYLVTLDTNASPKPTYTIEKK